MKKISNARIKGIYAQIMKCVKSELDKFATTEITRDEKGLLEFKVCSYNNYSNRIGISQNGYIFHMLGSDDSHDKSYEIVSKDEAIDAIKRDIDFYRTWK